MCTPTVTTSLLGDGQRPGIYVGQVDGAGTRRLLEADGAVFAAPGQLLFVRQGALYAQAFDPERIELHRKAHDRGTTSRVPWRIGFRCVVRIF